MGRIIRKGDVLIEMGGIVLRSGDMCDVCNKTRACAISKGKRVCVACCEQLENKNYGCFPCPKLERGECKGAKPGTFYYPNECDGFENEDEEPDPENYLQDYDEDW